MAAPSEAIRQLPYGPGVYRFRDAQGRVLYVGRAVNLRRRVRSYWGDLGSRWRLRAMVPQIAEVEATVCASEHESSWLERNLLLRNLPRWNRTAGGQEVPVYLRLSGHRECVLEVVHELPGPVDLARPWVSVFGPYLGGVRARLLVSGLQRVVPLRSAAPRLSGAERDLLRARGMAVLEASEAVARLSVILDRQPGPVSACLERLEEMRSAAAANLAFELAGKIHGEIAAIRWAAAEQRVASSTPIDADIAGWADGLLTTYQLRSGVLDRWTRKRCGSAAAQAVLEQTPPSWREFAEHNAELAARLHRVSL